MSSDARSAVFSAPVGLLSVNALPSEYPKEVLDHLKDVNRLIVLEVSNPDDVFAIAQKQKLKVLIDSASPKTGERSFSLALPGEIIVTVHGKPEELPAGMEGELKRSRQAVRHRSKPVQCVHHRTPAARRARRLAAHGSAPTRHRDHARAGQL